MGPRDTTWRTITGVRGTQSTLTGLTACTYYMFRIRANCTTTSGSVWSQTARFQTTGCVPPCVAPKNLKVYVSDTVAVISWVGTATSSYRLIVTNSDNTFTREVTVTGNVYNLTGLLRCKTYKIQIKTVCSTTSVSEIVTTTFETKGCPVPCSTPREVSFQADTNKVTLKWTNMGATKYYIEYRLAVDSLPWKRDSATTFTKVITGLQSCKTYIFRIASVCSNGTSSFSSPFGVTTIGCPAPCIPTTGLSSEIVNDTVLVVKFNFMTAQSYTVQYRVAGTATWTSLPTSIAANLPIRITGLLKCTSYQWRVLRNCNATTLGESDIQTVKTGGCPTPCAVPRDLSINNYAADSAKLTWIMPTAALTYEIRYAAGTNDSAFLNATVTRSTTNSVVLRGLVLCRYYVAQVRTVCPNGQVSDWVTTNKFRVGANCQSIEPSSSGLNEKTQYISDFGIYPNPGSETLQVAYVVEKDANIKVELINLQGQMVSRIEGGNQEVGSYVQTLDNVAQLNTGIYLVVIRANGKVVNTQKWQKQ
jgi:trimeric autotransporter adhesin